MTKNKDTMRKGLLFLLLCVTRLTATAQDDITKYYLTNYGFDTDFNYTADSKARVAQEILDIPGWTAELSADYTITGIYEFGFGGTFNGASVPAQGFDGEAGGGLALSTGWEQTFVYYQTVTLPKGTYTITAPTYNGKTATRGTSLLAWVPATGSSVGSAVDSYPSKKWTEDQVSFTLTKTTRGRIQIGYKAAAGGSANSACLLIDYVRLTGQDMAVSKTALKTSLNTANKAYGNGTGEGATELKAAIDQAQAVYDDTEATMPQVLEAAYVLDHVLEDYQMRNASEQNPVDVTTYIANPSFEQNGTTGWTTQNMQTQSNSVFSRKQGTYYLESWVGIGQQIGDAAVTQVIPRLPRGRYQLTASALHIQQSGSNSTTNKGAAQTGADLVAGTAKTAVTSMKQYTVSFAVVEETEAVKIGLRAQGATGNYLCVDNFKLQYIGQVSDADLAQEVQNLVEKGQAYLDKGIQQTVATALTAAIDQARTALQGTGTGTDGQTLYDAAALGEARTALLSTLEAAEASRQLYDALQERIDYAEKVLGWWQGDTRKAGALTNLATAIETAREKLVDYTLTDAQLRSAANTLNTRTKAVDKRIYCSANACGSDTELQNPDSYWSYERSMQSKHWILFWEKGYGTDAPSAVPGILERADQIFEFYADSLGYITINQGKSKTDTYKMIIRLRHSTDWEASGSGIDNQIGLLTLSNGAHTSRSGQTVAHEIGHCFQYQTHCDNGDWNGWMYNWGQSTLNVFWEMCAQWQAYKFYPQMQFVWDSGQGNDWFGGTINGLHRHPLCVDLRYNNYFIQDYLCHKQGDMKFLGRMWNESKNPEDPLQTYMRLTMTGTTAQKLSQLGDEMWEYGARMTTFDLDPIREQGKSRIGFRSQTALTKDADQYWWPKASDCIENWGNNAIRLNAPTTKKTIYVEFEGEAGADGYTAYNTNKAGWRVGFVALQRDGTRLYGDIGRATYAEPQQTLAFECPAQCQYVWLVVSGAPTSYWTRDWLSWSEESTAEQWPYRVKLHQTNVYGQPNNNTLPTGIAGVEMAETASDGNVYSVTGQVVRRGTTSLQGLPQGIYIVDGRKVMVKGE